MIKPLRISKPVTNSAAISPRKGTPVERYFLRGVPIDVKREDLCWPFPALAKARGVWAAIEQRPSSSLAVVDTARSLNGQLVATIGATLGRRVVCGYPVYKKDPTAIPGPTIALKAFGVELVPIPANRQFVMRSYMTDWLRRKKAGEPWFLFPTGLRVFQELREASFWSIFRRGSIASSPYGCRLLRCETGSNASLPGTPPLRVPSLELVSERGDGRAVSGTDFVLEYRRIENPR